MHLIIASAGTRGDVQPYVALGMGLVRAGHSVTVATNEEHRGLVETHGLAHRSVCGSFRELLKTPAGVRWLESSDSPLEYLRAFDELFSPVGDDWLAQYDAALEDADAVLVHSFTIAAIVALERRNVPRVVLSPFSAVPSGELGMSGLPRIPWITDVFERAAGRYFFDRVWAFAHPSSERFREQHGLEPQSKAPWRRNLEEGVGHLHLFSEHIAPRPSDWPACAEVTGYCFLDADADLQPPSTLVDFLEAGPPPLYVGFGSMTGMDPAVLAATTRDALHTAGQRTVIGMGWGGLASFESGDDVLLVDDVPHDWLFPRVSAVVHHGGAGTTAAALRAGKPSVVVPFFADQPFWASRLAKLGLGAKPVPKRKLSAPRLAAAITRVVSEPAYTERAEAMGATIRQEDGVARAVERALHYLDIHG